jgi:L-2-hydroxyglutarate oxidase
MEIMGQGHFKPEIDHIEMKRHDHIIIGGGIVGLSTAYHLLKERPGCKVLLLEKEPLCATHQSGRNSGVIHSGIYYRPGSFKAKYSMDGAKSMREFCMRHDIPVMTCGKLIVATRKHELAGLEELKRRGQANGVPVDPISPERAQEIEPHVKCLAALHVRSTGVTDYSAVCTKLLELIVNQGGAARFGEEVTGIRNQGGVRIIKTRKGHHEANQVINCAGLHSDRIVRMAGSTPAAAIVPFRGEYHQLIPGKRHLVRALVYPVPHPAFPFLGAHFTRGIDGSVHVGPNAVLALKREGYRKRDMDWRDIGDTLRQPGFWKLAGKHALPGLGECWRSLVKGALVRMLQRMIPEIRSEDLVPANAGVRAQAIFPDGRLADDFLTIRSKGILHVCNAPSPAATAAIEIGRSVARQIA